MFDDLRQAVKNIEFIANPTVGEVEVGAHEPLIVGVLPAVFDYLHGNIREFRIIRLQSRRTRSNIATCANARSISYSGA